MVLLVIQETPSRFGRAREEAAIFVRYAQAFQIAKAHSTGEGLHKALLLARGRRPTPVLSSTPVPSSSYDNNFKEIYWEFH
jgi:hypothetical protein